MGVADYGRTSTLVHLATLSVQGGLTWSSRPPWPPQPYHLQGGGEGGEVHLKGQQSHESTLTTCLLAGNDPCTLHGGKVTQVQTFYLCCHCSVNYSHSGI